VLRTQESGVLDAGTATTPHTATVACAGGEHAVAGGVLHSAAGYTALGAASSPAGWVFTDAVSPGTASTSATYYVVCAADGAVGGTAAPAPAAP
jgi:hypothetical protein